MCLGQFVCLTGGRQGKCLGIIIIIPNVANHPGSSYEPVTVEIPAGHFSLKIDEVLCDNTIIFRWKVSCNGKPDRPGRCTVSYSSVLHNL